MGSPTLSWEHELREGNGWVTAKDSTPWPATGPRSTRCSLLLPRGRARPGHQTCPLFTVCSVLTPYPAVDLTPGKTGAVIRVCVTDRFRASSVLQ